MFLKRKAQTTIDCSSSGASSSSTSLQKSQRTRVGAFAGVSFLKYALYAVSLYIILVHMLFMNYGYLQSYWSNLDIYLEENKDDDNNNDNTCSTSDDISISRSFEWCDESFCLSKEKKDPTPFLLVPSSNNEKKKKRKKRKRKGTIQSLVIYNPLDHERHFCGKTIPAKKVRYFSVDNNHNADDDNNNKISNINETKTRTRESIDLSCFLQDGESMSLSDSLSTLYSLPPIIGNRDKISPPIQMEFASAGKKEPFSQVPFTECDVRCQERGKASVTGGFPKKVLGTKWKIIKSLEGPQYYGHLRFQDNAYRQDRYYSTTSFLSEIPTPYFTLNNEMKDQFPPVEYETGIRGASFLARNCGSKNDRESLVRNLTNHMIQKGWIPAREIQKGNSTNSTPAPSSPVDTNNFIRIDRLGKCLNNADPPPGVNLHNKHDTMRAYLFHLAFENQNEKDYITEKLWNVLKAGTIPVYFGHETIYEHLPGGLMNSIINVHDFDSYEDLGNYLVKVANNKTLYESYHAWRKKPYPLSFVQKFNFTSANGKCRTCRWAYAKKYGLAFDHPSQTVQELFIPRKLCWNKKKKEEEQLEQQQVGENQDYEQVVVVNQDLELEVNASLFISYPFRESWLISPQPKNGMDATSQQNNKESRPECVASTLMPMEEKCEKNSTIVLKSSISFKGTSSFLHRIVQYHDGIIDMTISMEENPSSSVRKQQKLRKDAQNFVLQLDMMSSFLMASMKGKHVNNSSSNNDITFNQFGKRESFIQNEVSRMTVLTDWDVEIENPNDGILHIPIVFEKEEKKQEVKVTVPTEKPTVTTAITNTSLQNNTHEKNNLTTISSTNKTHEKNLTTISSTVRKNERTLFKRSKPTKRIRFIVENVDTFHKGANSQLYYYFGQLMKNDFVRPLEKKIVVEEEKRCGKSCWLKHLQKLVQ